MENEAMEIMENVADAIVEENTAMPDAQEVANVRGEYAWIKPVVFITVLAGAYIVVKKDQIKKKITEHRIKKLTQAGYIVLDADEIVDETHEEHVDEVAD